MGSLALFSRSRLFAPDCGSSSVRLSLQGHQLDETRPLCIRRVDTQCYCVRYAHMLTPPSRCAAAHFSRLSMAAPCLTDAPLVSFIPLSVLELFSAFLLSLLTFVSVAVAMQLRC